MTAQANGMERTLWAFCSAKGGVGKSTLAVLCAKLLAKANRTCVLVDADLTGTSLADGLRLCAPRAKTRSDGSLKLDEPPDGFLTRDETLELRKARADSEWENVAPPPPYLNDVLTHGHEDMMLGDTDQAECTLRTALWKHEIDDGVLYLPSSPLRRDIAIALGFLYYEGRHAWVRRMCWLIEGMREQIPHLTDVVLDLPPGLFGFTDEVLSLLAHVGSGAPPPPGYPTSWGTDEGRWRARPYLVTTGDRNDLAVAMRYFFESKHELKTLLPILNRSNEAPERILDDLRRDYGVLIDSAHLMRYVGRLDMSLGIVFTGAGDLPLSSDLLSLRRTFDLNDEDAP